MTPPKTNCLVCSAVLLVAAFVAFTSAEDKAGEPVVLVDAAGKEHKIKGWQLLAGTRKLGWLAPAAEKPKDEPEPKGKPPAKGPVGPDALIFRDDQSTNYVNGILTLIPLESLRSVEFDAEKQTATAKVAIAGEGAEDSLTGTTKFADNKLTLECEVDKGELGIAAVKFQGGIKGGIKSVRFPNPKPVAALPAGRTAVVSIVEKDGKKNEQKAIDLMPLYKFDDGTEQLLPTLLFKKTLKVDVAKLQKFAFKNKAEDGSEWGVTLKGADEETFTLLPKGTFDGKTATLEGLVGRVPVGYKLFPMHTIAAVEFDVK